MTPPHCAGNEQVKPPDLHGRSAPSRIRTCNLLIRNQTRYPLRHEGIAYVRVEGLEPPRPKTPDPKSGAATITPYPLVVVPIRPAVLRARYHQLPPLAWKEREAGETRTRIPPQ